MNYYTWTTLLVVAICQVANGQLLTKFRVSTQMSTYTQTILTSTICAKLNDNPMPVCRRRGFPVLTEEPIASNEQFLIQPTNTLQVEPTAVPFWGFDNDQISGFDENSYLNLASPYAIQPSLWAPLSIFQRRIPFANDYLIENRQGLITFITLTYTKTTTEIEMTTTTKTIAVSGCTPSPFPFDVCV